MKICPICNNKEDDIGAVFCSECGFRFQDSSPNTGKSMMYAPTSLNDSGGEDRRSHGELTSSSIKACTCWNEVE